MRATSIRNKTSASLSRRRQINPRIWLIRHLQVALSSLGRLARTPFSSLMTIAVIGIALALPSGLHLMLSNIRTLSNSWDGAASISVYLVQTASDETAAELAKQLHTDPEISEVRVITRQQALTEFRQMSGFSGILSTLEENPLPAVLVVKPDQNLNDPGKAQNLATRLSALENVEFAQLDLQWVTRFHAITEIANRVVWVVASLLGLAVILIIVNTIRLEIQNRHAEIEISKLIGATDSFIRRPLLYSGAWYGLFGGLVSWLLVTLSLLLLSAPVSRLAGLYQSDFELAGIDFNIFILLLSSGALLGLAGSWIAVARHLHNIEPN
ncbi:MAG: permease-like cell division protein FtsX [Gammaproteobacteria bacterium]|nr:permease-like cell division protein FtsX [Gammaproteobacteria bacterium]MCP5415853.1 cell division protein FtsX [Chromatiaceae bacterium]